MARRLWQSFWLIFLQNAAASVVWDFGTDSMGTEVISQLSGDLGYLVRSKKVTIIVPPCKEIRYVRVEVFNELSTPAVSYNKDTHTVVITNNQLLINVFAKYEILAKGRSMKNCGNSGGGNYQQYQGIHTTRRPTTKTPATQTWAEDEQDNEDDMYQYYNVDSSEKDILQHTTGKNNPSQGQKAFLKGKKLKFGPISSRFPGQNIKLRQGIGSEIQTYTSLENYLLPDLTEPNIYIEANEDETDKTLRKRKKKYTKKSLKTTRFLPRLLANEKEKLSRSLWAKVQEYVGWYIQYWLLNNKNTLAFDIKAIPDFDFENLSPALKKQIKDDIEKYIKTWSSYNKNTLASHSKAIPDFDFENLSPALKKQIKDYIENYLITWSSKNKNTQGFHRQPIPGSGNGDLPLSLKGIGIGFKFVKGLLNIFKNIFEIVVADKIGELFKNK